MTKTFKIKIATPVHIEYPKRDTYKARFHPPNPNFRMHWRERMKWNQEWKAETLIAAQKLKLAVGNKVIKPTIQPIFYTLQEMDQDNANAAVKSLIDGIVAAGIIKDDKQAYCTIMPTRQIKVPKRAEQGVEIVIKYKTDG